ncbi:cytochrome b/b6 domain-containing protein [Sandarakinorhabdus sp.]|uniref:cytochrome b/b6 domain-containing protein n=1 Tax=Sandarakinorhabdus sp. TaxID=1916663 RepID=UPI00286E95AE|nr:cytochrome b/b6 domain-containing protein [Sandarakinorhabdus sp.]
MASMAESADGHSGRLVPRHTGVVRLTHWINALAIVLLLMTGANIFNAHPRLYWGMAGSVDQRAGQWLEIGASGPAAAPRGYLELGNTRIDTTGVLGVSGANVVVGYPGWATFPSQRDLATARNWHFFFAWVIILNGLLYLGHGLWSGHIRRDLLPRLGELSPAHMWHDIVSHAKLQFPKGEAMLRYGSLQKIAYAGTALLLVPLVILTGMTMSPGLNAAFPFLNEMFGGRQSARSLHWIAANLILVFILVHLLMVVLSGPINQLRGMITGKLKI